MLSTTPRTTQHTLPTPGVALVPRACSRWRADSAAPKCSELLRGAPKCSKVLRGAPEVLQRGSEGCSRCSLSRSADGAFLLFFSQPCLVRIAPVRARRLRRWLLGLFSRQQQGCRPARSSSNGSCTRTSPPFRCRSWRLLQGLRGQRRRRRRRRQHWAPLGLRARQPVTPGPERFRSGLRVRVGLLCGVQLA